ncbi:hypothetical protein [uncultured Deefgea sp.]|uniref:hypothetical protein n=1 Tax=uncultured Deefgea sp. TaxID=1304914 RepID=UPI00260B77B1|nr:hypothetical protein [uncultured Deefgea sp.]
MATDIQLAIELLAKQGIHCKNDYYSLRSVELARIEEARIGSGYRQSKKCKDLGRTAKYSFYLFIQREIRKITR